MGWLNDRRLVRLVVFAGASTFWTPFHSSIYPYSVSQPSSFRHVILPNAANRQVDFFFPSLGSFTTNVNIVANPKTVPRKEIDYLKSLGGQNVHQSGWLTFMGKRRRLVRADFSGLAGKYTVEQALYVEANTEWQLTASYAQKYRSWRTTMVKMLDTFKTDP